MKDYYSILGVAPDATAAQIKKAFRKLAKRYHPDATGGDKAKESRFKEISDAHEVIGDEKKRAEYDRQRREAAEAAAGHRTGGGFQDFGGAGLGVDLEDLLGRMRGGRGASWEERPAPGPRRRRGRNPIADILDGLGGAAPGGMGGMPGMEDVLQGGLQREESPGSVHAELEVDFVEAAKGGTRTVTLDIERACTACAGPRRYRRALPGLRRQRHAARRRGLRRAGRHHVHPLRRQRPGGRARLPELPGTQGAPDPRHSRGARSPGVDTGSIIRLRGRGPAEAAGQRSVRAGDLLLRIKVRPHPRFERAGADVNVSLPLTIEEAVLGARVEVPTIDGTAALRIPPGTSSGPEAAPARQGRLQARHQGAGDEYVRIEIVVPTRSTSAPPSS